MDGGDYKPDDVHAVNVFSEAAGVPHTLRSNHACQILMPKKKKHTYSTYNVHVANLRVCILLVYIYYTSSYAYAYAYMYVQRASDFRT